MVSNWSSDDVEMTTWPSRESPGRRSLGRPGSDPQALHSKMSMLQLTFLYVLAMAVSKCVVVEMWCLGRCSWHDMPDVSKTGSQ